jgi:ribosome biogenesis GTPase A
LSGSKKALTSSECHFTKGIQEIRSSKNIVILDTPGIIPFIQSVDEIEYETRLVLLSSVNENRIKNPIEVILNLIKIKPEMFKFYEIDPLKKEIDNLEHIAKKLNKIGKDGSLDVETTSRMLISKIQKGKL